MEIIDELLDDGALDPKKLFDENEFSTLIVNREGFSKKQNGTADLVQALLSKKNTRQENEEIFSALKTANAQKLLVDTLQSAKKTADKITLTAACWESGLDFSPYYWVFVELACSDDFTLALEALTVVEHCEGPFEETKLKEALTIAQHTPSRHTTLIGDLISFIKSHTI